MFQRTDIAQPLRTGRADVCWIQLKEELWVSRILLSVLGCGQVAMGTLVPLGF